MEESLLSTQLFNICGNDVEVTTAIYSVIEAVKVNQLKPYQCLCHICTILPKIITIDKIKASLLWSLNSQEREGGVFVEIV